MAGRKHIKVAVLFGGRSAEHEVSVKSAKNIIAALNKKKYKALPVYLDKSGRWPFKNIIDFFGKVDVVFPALHGTYGEDGTMQGFLKIMNIPFVGPDALGSALGMDKDIAKKLLRAAGVNVARSETFSAVEKDKIIFDSLKKKLGLPMFVKPANAGSSVGVSKVKSAGDFKSAVRSAFLYDNKILVEEFIDGREIEISVLGNENCWASCPGEIISNHEFYSYEAKYIDENGAKAVIPAPLPRQLSQKMRSAAIKTFKVLQCEGMSRVDFFVQKNGKFYVNEINTIPGFTDISMYPKLWSASKIAQKKLIDKLITLAIQRHKRNARLKTSF